MNHSVFGKDRHYITVLFVSVLTAVALKSGIDSIFDIVGERDFVPKWDQWILPWVFIVTLIRFAVGTYNHLLELEPDDNGRKGIGDGIWFMDLFVIAVVELGLIALMGHSSDSHPKIFVILLAILCFVDVVWVISVGVICRLTKLRPGRTAPWKWCWINALSGVALVGILLLVGHGMLNLESLGVLITLGGGFTLAAGLDLYWQLKGRLT